MKINIEEIVSNPALALVAAKHLAYSMQDVNCYDELTPKEKEIISEKSFNQILISASVTYQKLKEKNPHHIILIRVGHFYNTYDDDAATISNTLGISLCQNIGESNKKATIPRHAIDTYLPKLIRAGYKVALCDNP